MPTDPPPLKPRHFPPPPPLVPASPGLWRRTPPAIFPPMMGLFGLGLAWRALAQVPGLQPLAPVGETLLGATLLLYAFGLIAWLAKPLRRPRAALDELQVLPGRAGMVAMVLCLMLAAAALTPYAPGVALVLVLAGIAALVALGIAIALTLLNGPVEQRIVTPVFHLTYVGYILAPLSLVPLGQDGAARLLVLVSLIAALVIWALSLRQILTRIPPAPLRPLLAIHAAPASLLAITLTLLGYPAAAAGFGLLALVLVATLAAFARWITASGFSPLWGAFTFPLAAAASASILALGSPGLWIGAVLLIAASVLNPWITSKVLKSWAKGDLAAKTNAATA